MLSRVQVVSGRVWLALYVKIVQVRGIEVAVIRNDRAQELINFFTRNDHYDQVRWNTILEWKEIVAMSLVLATGRPVAQPSREFPDQCLSDGSDVDESYPSFQHSSKSETWTSESTHLINRCSDLIDG